MNGSRPGGISSPKPKRIRNRDKTLFRHNQPRTNESYPCYDNVLEVQATAARVLSVVQDLNNVLEVQATAARVLSVVQDLNYVLQRTLSDQLCLFGLVIVEKGLTYVLFSTSQSRGKSIAIGKIHTDKLCDTPQERKTPTYGKCVHQISLFHTERNPGQLGAAVAYPRPALSVTKRKSHAPISSIKQTRVSDVMQSMVVEVLTSCKAGAPESASAPPKHRVPLESAPGTMPVLHSRVAIVGRNHTVVINQPCLQNPPGSRL